MNPDQDSFISGSGTLRPVIRPFSWHQRPDCAALQWRAAPMAGREQAQPRARSAQAPRWGWLAGSLAERWDWGPPGRGGLA